MRRAVLSSCGAGLALIGAILPEASFARPPASRVLDSEYQNYWETYRIMDGMVTCLAKQDLAGARALFFPRDNEQFGRDIAHFTGGEYAKACLIGATQVKFGSDLMLGYLAEFLMRGDGVPPLPSPPSAPVQTAGDYVWTIVKPNPAASAATRLTAICLVTRYPASAAELLRTKPLSGHELRVFNSLTEQVAACVPTTGQSQLHPMVLRSDIAIAYFRASHSGELTTAPAETLH